MSLFIIKPDAIQRKLTGQILTDLENEGFELTNARVTVPTKVQAIRHYAEHKDKEYFDKILRTIWSQGSIFIGVVWHPLYDSNRKATIDALRKFVGPYSNRIPGTLRYKYALSDSENAVHSSDSIESFEREYQIWL